MVSGKPSNNKSLKSGNNFNIVMILLCLFLVFLGKFDLIAIRSIKAFLSDFLAPVIFVFNKPVNEIVDVLDRVKSVSSLRDENIRMKSEIRRLKVWKSKKENQELELLELKELLKVIPENTYDIITGRVITAPGGIFANTVLINVGKKDGISVGQTAVSSYGLVGYVVNVGLSTSRILLVIDINSMIPVYFTGSNWPAVVQGLNGEFLKIKFLSNEANLIEGEHVQTSGHGGMLPSGISVGIVVKSYSGSYYVKPSVNFQRLAYVSIIKNFNAKQDVTKTFNGYAPMQMPKSSIGFKGINSSGTRVKGSVIVE